MAKHILITGANSGIGLAATKKLVEYGYSITFLVRSVPKAQHTLQTAQGAKPDVAIDYVLCDLSDMSAVKKAAEEIKAKHNRIDVLLNNAGGIFTELSHTQEGFEKTMAVCHFGHFYLTHLLWPLLQAAEKPRIINTSSGAHQMGKLNFEDPHWQNRSYSASRSYGDAKLANIYFTRSLAQKFGEQGVESHCFHPGVVNTNFGSNFSGIIGFVFNKLVKPFVLTPDKGAETLVYLAHTDELNASNGSYWYKQKPKKPNALAQDDQKAEQLWKLSEEALNINFSKP